MASYKVAYKVLGEQGESLKKVSKELDQYISQLNAVKGKLGTDNLFEEIRQNLTKLTADMEESRTILSMAGDFLTQSVQGYSNAEKKVVKRSEGSKSHQRDFYKNPVTVVSIGGGGAAAGAAAAGATVNYTDNSVHVTVNQAGDSGTGAASGSSAGSTSAARGYTPASAVSSMHQTAASSGMRSAAASMPAAASSAGKAASGKTASAGINGAAIAGVAAAAAAAAGAAGIAAAMKKGGKSEIGFAAASEIPVPVVDEELMNLEQQLEQAKQNLEEITAEAAWQNEGENE